MRWVGANPAVWFADGTNQQVVSGDVNGLALGSHWIYFSTADTDAHTTAVYANAVGDTVGIICRLEVTSDSEPLIMPVYSRGGNMTLDFLGAGAVDTLVLTSDAIIGKDFRTAANVGVVAGPVGIKFDKNGIYGYSGGVSKTFQLASATGKITVYDDGNFELRDFTTGNLIGNLDVETGTDDVILYTQTGNAIIGAIASRMTLIPSGDITFSDSFDALRPNTDTLVDLGTALIRWGHVYTNEITATTYHGVPGGITDFIDLDDTPGAYAGNATKMLKVNDTPDALIFTESVELSETLADNTASGIIRSMEAGENLAIGEAVYLHDDAGTDAVVKKAKADAYATMPCIGIAITAANSGNPVDIILFGIMYDTSAFAAFADPGDGVYVSITTAGALTTTQPSASGNLVQRVGEVTDDGGELLVAPNKYLLELA